MKKKLIALVCALALAVGLVGCSLSTPDSQTQRQNRKQRKASHRMLFFFVKSIISGI